MRLILASTSATRRRMLEAAGVSHEAMAAAIDEDQAKAELRGLGASALAEALACRKALSLAGDLVLGADQTLEREDGSMLSKPRSREEAFAQLKSLSGRTHRLHSAAAVAAEGTIAWRLVETVELSVRPLSDAFLQAYLDSEYEAIRWSVGGYRIEGPGVQLFDRIHGSHFAILGLPLLPLLAYLRERGVMAS
ncbi:MAG TPA: nucleoside triphosphate pyrophosphatase [Allosphingosinicella sp.]